jgi:hypothetical protein
MAISALVAATIGGSLLASSSANKAAKAQQQAAQANNNTQLQMFNKSVELTEPGRLAGNNALGALQYEYGLAPEPENYAGFQQSPGYAFRQQQGEQAMNRNASARGLRLSGSTLKDAAVYSQGLADQNYNQHLTGLRDLAGAGERSTIQQVQLGENYANRSGLNNTVAAQARASGYTNQSNAFNSGLNSLSSLYGFNKAGGFAKSPKNNSGIY